MQHDCLVLAVKFVEFGRLPAVFVCSCASSTVMQRLVSRSSLQKKLISLFIMYVICDVDGCLFFHTLSLPFACVFLSPKKLIDD